MLQAVIFAAIGWVYFTNGNPTITEMTNSNSTNELVINGTNVTRITRARNGPCYVNMRKQDTQEGICLRDPKTRRFRCDPSKYRRDRIGSYAWDDCYNIGRTCHIVYDTTKKLKGKCHHTVFGFACKYKGEVYSNDHYSTIDVQGCYYIKPKHDYDYYDTTH